MLLPTAVIWEPVAALRSALIDEVVERGYAVTCSPLVSAACVHPALVLGYVQRGTLPYSIELIATGAKLVALVDEESMVSDLALVQIGCSGVLDRGSSRVQIAVALDAIGAGMRTLRPPSDDGGVTRSRVDALSQISDEDLESFVMCARGRTIDQVAASTGRSRRTVQRQLATVYRRLGVSGLTGAVVVATAIGLLEPFGHGMA